MCVRRIGYFLFPEVIINDIARILVVGILRRFKEEFIARILVVGI